MYTFNHLIVIISWLLETYVKITSRDYINLRIYLYIIIALAGYFRDQTKHTYTHTSYSMKLIKLTKNCYK